MGVVVVIYIYGFRYTVNTVNGYLSFLLHPTKIRNVL